MNIETKIVRDGWVYERIGKTNFMVIYRDPDITNGGIAMAGSGTDVPTQLPIPHPHRILNMKLTHLDAAYALNKTGYNCRLETLQNVYPILSKAADQLWRKTDITGYRRKVSFRPNEGGPEPPLTWTLVIDGTSGHFILPEIRIQILGEP